MHEIHTLFNKRTTVSNLCNNKSIVCKIKSPIASFIRMKFSCGENLKMIVKLIWQDSLEYVIVLVTSGRHETKF